MVPFGVGGMAIYDLHRFYVSVQYIFGVAGKWVSGSWTLRSVRSEAGKWNKGDEESIAGSNRNLIDEQLL